MEQDCSRMPVVSSVRDGCMDFTSVTGKWKVEREGWGVEGRQRERHTSETDRGRDRLTERTNGETCQGATSDL